MDYKIILVLILVVVLYFFYREISKVQSNLAYHFEQIRDVMNETFIVQKKEIEDMLNNNIELIRNINTENIHQVRKMNIIQNEPIRKSSNYYTENDERSLDDEEQINVIDYLSDPPIKNINIHPTITRSTTNSNVAINEEESNSNSKDYDSSNHYDDSSSKLETESESMNGEEINSISEEENNKNNDDISSSEDNISVITNEINELTKDTLLPMKKYKLEALKKIARHNNISLSRKVNNRYKNYNKGELYELIKQKLE